MGRESESRSVGCEGEEGGSSLREEYRNTLYKRVSGAGAGGGRSGEGRSVIMEECGCSQRGR